jgi:cell shape-determining protein MreD
MGSLLAFPIIFILIMLQTTLVNEMTLLSGCADLVLLWLAAWSLQKQVKTAWLWTLIASISMAFVSAVPWFVSIIGYPVVTYFARFINKRIWQSPLLVMFVVTIVGSLVIQTLTYLSISIEGVEIPWRTGLVEVIIPSMLLNLLFALPIFALVKDLAAWVYPTEVEE